MKNVVGAFLLGCVVATPVTAQTAAEGEKVFRKCAGCHKVGTGAKNATGPVLNGVVGRPAGSFPGYNYSPSMVAAGAAGLVWTEDNIFAYVADPTKFLRSFLNNSSARAKMSFKLRNEPDRLKVIAFLATN